MGFFSGTNTANLRRTGVYLSDGAAIGDQHTYRIKVNAIKTVEGRGTKGMVVEFTVLESTYEKNPVGSNASWFANFTKVPEAGLRDAMLFVAAFFGKDPADEEAVRAVATEEVLEFVCDPSNPMGEYGVELICVTKTKLTKNNKPFAVHFFSPSFNPPPVPG